MSFSLSDELTELSSSSNEMKCFRMKCIALLSCCKGNSIKKTSILTKWLVLLLFFQSTIHLLFSTFIDETKDKLNQQRSDTMNKTKVFCTSLSYGNEHIFVVVLYRRKTRRDRDIFSYDRSDSFKQIERFSFKKKSASNP